MQSFSFVNRISSERRSEFMNRFYGTENFIQNVIEEYSDMLLRVSYTYLKNLSDAEDITQEIFVKLLEKQPTFQSREQEKPVR